jgi:hypothetical protein
MARTGRGGFWTRGTSTCLLSRSCACAIGGGTLGLPSCPSALLLLGPAPPVAQVRLGRDFADVPMRVMGSGLQGEYHSSNFNAN